MEDGGIVSQVFLAMVQGLLHLSFIHANVIEDGFGALNIAPKVSLRDKQTLALCNEAGESGDGNGGTVGSRQGDMEKGGRQGVRSLLCLSQKVRVTDRYLSGQAARPISGLRLG